MPASRPRPAVLCILDGWGWRPETQDNAIAAARTPNYTRMLADSPHALLATSGRAVGLPTGQMGNSEVGHMNIGAGRVVAQDLPRIDVAIEDGSFNGRPVLRDMIAKAKAANRAVHVMGLLSPGGVHSHQDHMTALVKAISAAGLPVFVHAFLDGRDTPPKSAPGFLSSFEKSIAGLPGVRIATVSGRYYAMDRDKRWERVVKAYDAIVDARGEKFDTPELAITTSYDGGVTDEFVVPCVIGEYAGASGGDALIFANFRADRAREISLALLDPGFEGFDRRRVVRFSAAAGMTEYSDELNKLMAAIFPAENITETLGQIAAERGLKQLRIAETEKYAHVTFFLNGGRETQFDGEDRILVPSPKVSTYDRKPEMSAPEVMARLEGAIQSGKYDLIVVNFANPDMVGHTGIMEAAIHAVDTIDECLGRLRAAVEKAGGVLLVTADHGNIEMMRDPVTHEPHTAHTTLDVPIIAINARPGVKLVNGRLADVAPTLLDLMGIPKPVQMTGHSLVEVQAEKVA
ncbi:MAG: 2,3-bisphosphoglycerate-independent phosphoglycerate mutase [Alphaproteobacteria bacterium]|nr:2,3-bisphosphoglycerate-independent phosphoglycerate mutase [Alphaproteobacteria bacterium]MBL6939850.1 2,3-bisphosphoglycerate-independent phosphoglycerate mutase [Alphaproteobacteria bacterium]MBL7098303.1 2,3-bisphosphoglycerate-independent phosphoglycerate mutase [Alphaproteobacteria bacterium]